MIYPGCFHTEFFSHNPHYTYLVAGYGGDTNYRSYKREIPNFIEVYWKSRYLMKTKFQASSAWCSYDSICLNSTKNRLCNSDTGAPLIVEEDGRRWLVGVVQNHSDCQNRSIFYATSIWTLGNRFFTSHMGNKICKERSPCVKYCDWY